MAYDSADLAALDLAIATGTTSVTYTNGTSSRSVTYRSLDEMLRLRSIMTQDISGSSVSFENRARTTQTDKGLG